MSNASRTEILNVKTSATLYLSGMFSWKRHEARNVRVEVGPYAQHARAYFVFWTPKGARKERGIVLTTISRKGLIFAGHGLPEVPDAFSAPAASGEGMTVSRSRGMSCDAMWDTEARAALRGLVPLLDLEADVATAGGRAA